MGRRTLARPLAGAFAALIVYASLYPFEGWRSQEAPLLSFLWAPWPRYWTGFDVFSNLAGYAPLGFLMGVWAWRASGSRWSLAAAVLAPSLLSLAMESLQVYLPSRVPSSVDWLLNTAGGWIGIALAWLAHRSGSLVRWQRLRHHWFVPDAHGALVLLVLWPAALLYPVALPFGLGQVGSVIETRIVQWLADTRFAHWWTVSDAQVGSLSLAMEAQCVALSVLVPCLLGYSVLRGLTRRLVHWAVFAVLGLGMSALSASLTYGPARAWAWLTEPVVVGLVLGGALGLMLVGLSRRASVVWMLLALVAALFLLNRMPGTPYLAESLDVWAQGRFIRFHGLTQWLGWLWPYAVLVHGLGQVGRRSAPEAGGSYNAPP